MANDSTPEEESVIPHSRSLYQGFALYGVVQGELYVAASRAMTLYRETMNRDRFIAMAGEMYDKVDLDARELFEKHQRQGGCQRCLPKAPEDPQAKSKP